MKYDKNLLNTDVLCFTETQITETPNLSDLDTINSHLEDFQVLFNNDPDKYKSLAIAYSSCISVNDQYKRSGFAFITLRKLNFYERSFNVLLLYRSHSSPVNNFLDQLSTIVRDNDDIDFILGDFNMN